MRPVRRGPLMRNRVLLAVASLAVGTAWWNRAMTLWPLRSSYPGISVWGPASMPLSLFILGLVYADVCNQLLCRADECSIHEEGANSEHGPVSTAIAAVVVVSAGAFILWGSPAVASIGSWSSLGLGAGARLWLASSPPGQSGRRVLFGAAVVILTLGTGIFFAVKLSK